MRPDFGSGVAQLVFAPNSVELASATQMLIQSALQQWLGELIVVQGVSVEARRRDAVDHGAVRDPPHRSIAGADLSARRSGAGRDLPLLRQAATRRGRRRTPTLNGIDYLEVDRPRSAATDPLRQRTLLVHCLKPLPAAFSRDNVRLDGGERVKNITSNGQRRPRRCRRSSASPAKPTTAAIVTARPNPSLASWWCASPSPATSPPTRCASSTSAIDESPPANFDPQLAAIDFSFKVDCPSDFDCKPVHLCPRAEAAIGPTSTISPRTTARSGACCSTGWRSWCRSGGRAASPIYGIALVELLAYVGDHLSYQQDAIAHRGLSRHRAPPHLAAPPCAAGRLPDA